MISVIIPIYQSETTLRRCIDSVLSQTERDLEILLIDDGSADGSGAIADDYAAKDARVRTFHVPHSGLSAARNYGLDRMNGKYVAFVDSDDWIEPQTYETALQFCADVCVFGCSRDYVGKTIARKLVPIPETIDHEEAVRRLIVYETINHGVWNKLYKSQLFGEIRFPEGAIYEDIRTTYRILTKAAQITLIPDTFYHYVQYDGSLSQNPAALNQLDRWDATYELYRVFNEKGKEYREGCIRKCAYSIYRAWGSLWKTDREFRREKAEKIKEIVLFAKKYRHFVCFKTDCGVHVKAAVVFASFGSRWSQWCGYRLLRTARLLKPMRLFKRTEAEQGDD